MARRDVCFGSEADIGANLVRQLFDHLVGAAEQWTHQGYAERLGGLEVDDQLGVRSLLLFSDGTVDARRLAVP
jgi:hypothetical protein